MTEDNTNPYQRPSDPAEPEKTSELPRQEGDVPAEHRVTERFEPQAGAPAGPYAPPPQPGPWSPNPWQQPVYTPQQTSGVPAHQPPPIWAPPPGPGDPGAGMPPPGPGGPPTMLAPPMGPPRPPSRAGRRLAAGAAVLALAVGSGVLGGWIALQADDDPTTVNNTGNATSTSNSDPAPVINRDDLANVAAAVQPSVVSIKTDSAEGSGVVYDTTGNIVTNNHVVAGADSVRVIFSDGNNTEAEVVATDPKSDLAVVKVSNVSGLTAAKFGDSGGMRVGDTVLALGSPLGLQGTVTAGIISALDRTIQVGDDQQPQNPFQQQQQQGGTTSISGLLQTDAPINPGNSGGALANTKGEVIGINTAIAGNSSGNIGVGFAIPSNKVKSISDQLIKGGKVSHPFLGVSVADATNGGALVRTVTPDSPAAKAGLQEGDVITKFGDKAISDDDDLVSAVQAGKVGDQVQLTYTRNGEQKTATVTLAETS